MQGDEKEGGVVYARTRPYGASCAVQWDRGGKQRGGKQRALQACNMARVPYTLGVDFWDRGNKSRAMPAYACIHNGSNTLPQDNSGFRVRVRVSPQPAATLSPRTAATVKGTTTPCKPLVAATHLRAEGLRMQHRRHNELQAHVELRHVLPPVLSTQLQGPAQGRQQSGRQ